MRKSEVNTTSLTWSWAPEHLLLQVVLCLPFPLEYVQRYASKEAAEQAGAESEDDDDMSSVASFGEDDDDEEPAGRLDDV